MKLTIIDIEKTVSFHVTWLEINTPVGNMTILDNHVPTIIELQPNHELIFEEINGEQKHFMIHQAIAHITRSEVKILIPAIA
ncbi:hypothetical protein HYV11_03675 [Candidatus Dependentiae bacterium]|nr:hypothetical protein [Candidatus Dependentiae bacterium]